MATRRPSDRPAPHLPRALVEELFDRELRCFRPIAILRSAEGDQDDVVQLGRLVLRTSLLPHLRAMVEAADKLAVALGDAPLKPADEAWLRRQLEGMGTEGA